MHWKCGIKICKVKDKKYRDKRTYGVLWWWLHYFITCITGTLLRKKKYSSKMVMETLKMWDKNNICKVKDEKYRDKRI